MPDKTSFVLYTDYLEQIEMLSREQRGDLITAIFYHVSGMEIPELDGMTNMAFSFIRSRLDKDGEKYQSIVEKRREAGKKGGRPSKPNSIEDKINFEKKLERYKITKEELKAYVRHDKYKEHRMDEEFFYICSEIRKSFDKCITENSDILQGCVWRINLEEIEKIEILKNDGYRYGSLNYIRSNGKRINWIKDYYKKLK